MNPRGSKPSASPDTAAARPLRIRLDRAITLRALAILAVVAYHAYTVPFGAVLNNVDAPSGIAGAVARMLQWLPGVEQAVAVFFLMAGYFAHRAYQRSRLSHSRHARRTFLKFFLWRRFWRLVPPFWVALVFSYLVGFDHPFTVDGLRKLLVNASLLKTLYPGYFFSINSAHWYVAVQCQLDLLYPLFLYILARRSVTTAVVMACATAALVTFVVPHFTVSPWLVNLPMRWWAEWALGVYLADRHLAGARVFPRPGWTLLAASIALFAGGRSGLAFLPWVAIRVMLACGFEAMLLSRPRRFGWERRLALVGVCSYSLYLLHIPVQQLVAELLVRGGLSLQGGLGWLAFAAISFVMALALAKLSADWLELECAAWGNRMWRRRFLIRAWTRTRRRQFVGALAALARVRRRTA